LLGDFKRKYPEYRVVSDYFLPRQQDVRIVDVSEMLADLVDDGTA
jgi:hypothetical protein